MAIIKCPECGHQISDKAHVCPSCGVEIAGKVTKCANCGEVYFLEEETCPNCHQPNPLYRSSVRATATKQSAEQKFQQPSTPAQQSDETVSQQNSSREPETVHSGPVTPPPVHPATPPTVPKRSVTPPVPPKGNSDNLKDNEKHKKNNKSWIWISLLIAVIICSVCFYFYNNAKNGKEEEAYEYAMQSTDPLVLKSYLDNYLDAPEAHRDSIQSHLNMLKQTNDDWNNVLVSDSKSALEDYLKNHPDSPHKQDAWNKIDSIDWADATNENTLESYQEYLKEHADGQHVDEANDAMKKIKSKDVQPEEKQMISGLFRRFFQSVNSRNEGGLTSTVEDVMESFLGKSMATKSDVASFIDKIYKDDITNMNFKINNDYKIKKHEVGDDEYEYQVQFTADQTIDRTDPSQPTSGHFRINAKVSPDGKISSLNMVKIIK